MTPRERAETIAHLFSEVGDDRTRCIDAIERAIAEDRSHNVPGTDRITRPEPAERTFYDEDGRHRKLVHVTGDGAVHIGRQFVSGDSEPPFTEADWYDDNDSGASLTPDEARFLFNVLSARYVNLDSHKEKP